MNKWEYEVIYWDAMIYKVGHAQDLKEILNEYGENGWEVVSMTHQIGSAALADDNGLSAVDTESLVILLKRAIEE